MDMEFVATCVIAVPDMAMISVRPKELGRSKMVSELLGGQARVIRMSRGWQNDQK